MNPPRAYTLGLSLTSLHTRFLARADRPGYAGEWSMPTGLTTIGIQCESD